MSARIGSVGAARASRPEHRDAPAGFRTWAGTVDVPDAPVETPWDVSEVVDVVRRLEWIGHRVTVHDPLADPAEAEHEYGLKLDPSAFDRRYNAVIGAVPHKAYRSMGPAEVTGLLETGGLVADVKGMWRAADFPASVKRWQL